MDAMPAEQSPHVEMNGNIGYDSRYDDTDCRLQQIRTCRHCRTRNQRLENGKKRGPPRHSRKVAVGSHCAAGQRTAATEHPVDGIEGQRPNRLMQDPRIH